MQVRETTPPIERTFDLTGLNTLQLKVLRLSLVSFVEDEEADRKTQDDRTLSLMAESASDTLQKHVPVPMSLEEVEASAMLDGIRKVERNGLF